MPGIPLLSAQRKLVIRDQERPFPLLAHGRHHLLGHQERPAAGDVLRCFKHLNRDVLQKFHFRRQVTPLQIARVVDQYFRVAGLVSDLSECIRNRFRRDQVKLNNHAVAALFPNRCLQRRCIAGNASGQHHEVALLGELLSNGTTNAPTHANWQVTVIKFLAMGQFCVAAV